MTQVFFKDGFHGMTEIGGQTLQIAGDRILPYDLTYSAIAACLYSTFLDVLEEMQLHVEQAIVDVNGVKRETVPPTVQNLFIHVQVKSTDELMQLRMILAKAASRCSMVQTFAQVAEQIDMDLDLM